MSKVRKERKAGFTMIEVLLVIVLFSIAVAAISPNFKQFYDEIVFDGVVQRVVKLFEYARARAVMDNTFIRLSIDIQGKTYLIENKDETDGQPEKFTPIKGTFGRTFTLPGDLRFGTITTDEIYINPDGSVEKYTIEIEDEGRKRVRIMGQGYFGTPTITEEVL